MKNFFIPVLFLLMSSIPTSLASSSDDYLSGYIQSIFVHSYFLPSNTVVVKNGVVLIDESKLGHYNAEPILQKIKQITSSLPGIKDVKLAEETGLDKNLRKGKAIKHTVFTQKPISQNLVTDGLMLDHSLFQPLIADPKWPRFTLAYQYHIRNRVLLHAFAPNFGASFSLYRIRDNSKDQEWDLSIQAGLFGVMDIGTKTTALINADYFVGVPLSYRRGTSSLLLRPYHISSHLGDEFMLTRCGKATKRINLSYEGIDLILSHNIGPLRIYGGGGYLVHKEPSYIKPLKLQAGSEYYAERTFMGGRLRPVSAIDIKLDQNQSWVPAISIKTGIQIENSILLSNKVLLMLEFYSGKSMHGQFYQDRLQTIGIGLHVFL